MGELYFKIELLDDVVLSQKTATVGNHKSLDYIPGSVLLGVAAARSYSKVSAKDAWELFNSSKLRFFNAYPLVNNKRAIPVPLSFHKEKEPELGKEKDIYNFACEEGKSGITGQPRQLRSGYLNLLGKKDEKVNAEKINIVLPSLTSRMRTAIDEKTGTAAKSQLYGYESLNAGQVFMGKIEWDDSVDTSVKNVKELFESKSEEIIHIGRSKTASYGRAKLSKIDNSESIEKKETFDELPVNIDGNSFSILAVSDLCLRNPVTGTPELKVLPEFLGLGADWKLDENRCFTRPSFIYQYNAYRKELEIQKTLISKGSVFTFKSESTKKLTEDKKEQEQVLESIKEGIGEAKNQGFGEISLFNLGPKFIKEEIEDVKSIETEGLSDDDKAWLTWLRPGSISKDVFEIVQKAFEDFMTICRSIGNGTRSKTKLPGKNQWGKILILSRTCDKKKDLYSQLFEGENPLIKPKRETKTQRNGDVKLFNSDPEWNNEGYLDGKNKTLREWLMDFVKNDSLNDKNMRIALQELSKRCKEEISDDVWLKNN